MSYCHNDAWVLVSRCCSREEQLAKFAGRAGISVPVAGKFSHLLLGWAFGEVRSMARGTVLAHEVFVIIPMAKNASFGFIEQQVIVEMP